MILNTSVDDRIAVMDAARGFAILGILIANIFIFALPYQALAIPEIWGEMIALNTATWDFVTIFVDGVMRCMISILFGASILIQLSHAEKKAGKLGISSLDPFFRRLLLLIAFGLFHAYVLLWPYDILYLYGLFGLLLFPFRNWSARALTTLGMLMLVASILTGAEGASPLKDAELQTADAINDNAADMGNVIEPFVYELPDANAPTQDMLSPSADAEDLALIKGFEDEMSAIIADMEEEMEARSQGYLSNLTSLAEESFIEQTSEVFRHHFLDVTTMMIFGMALFKSGFLRGAWPVRRYIAIAAVCYPVAIVLGLVAGWSVADPVGMAKVFNFVSEHAYDPRRLLFALGNFSIIAALTRAGTFRFLMDRLEACGRMALSLYIGQTLTCIFLFYGFGLGLFGKLEHVELMLLGLVLVLIQLIVAKIWLVHFRQGPLEWLLRRLSHGKLYRAPENAPLSAKRGEHPAE